MGMLLLIILFKIINRKGEKGNRKEKGKRKDKIKMVKVKGIKIINKKMGNEK